MASRLARSRTRAIPDIVQVQAVDDPSTPFSAGELYASYDVDDITPIPIVPSLPETSKPKDNSVVVANVPRESEMPPGNIRTPTWLKPLRLVRVFQNLFCSFTRSQIRHQFLHLSLMWIGHRLLENKVTIVPWYFFMIFDHALARRRPSLPYSDSSDYGVFVRPKNSLSEVRIFGIMDDKLYLSCIRAIPGDLQSRPQI